MPSKPIAQFAQKEYFEFEIEVKGEITKLAINTIGNRRKVTPEISIMLFTRALDNLAVGCLVSRHPRRPSLEYNSSYSSKEQNGESVYLEVCARSRCPKFKELWAWRTRISITSWRTLSPCRRSIRPRHRYCPWYNSPGIGRFITAKISLRYESLLVAGLCIYIRNDNVLLFYTPEGLSASSSIFAVTVYE